MKHRRISPLVLAAARCFGGADTGRGGRPSDDSAADGATGHAHAFLAWLHQTGFTPALGWVIAAMQARCDEADAGLRAAFLDEIARHAFAGFGVIGAAAGEGMPGALRKGLSFDAAHARAAGQLPDILPALGLDAARLRSKHGPTPGMRN
ncbi:MAG: hypothetical protein HYV16_00415 [Gammaproteobacteria bacterium]|nr:hypothetical protein [Gammaproteobacteria bacterium]